MVKWLPWTQVSLGQIWDYNTSALIPEPGLQWYDDGFLPCKDLDNMIIYLAFLEAEKNTGTCKECGHPISRCSQEYTEAVIPAAPCIWPDNTPLHIILCSKHHIFHRAWLSCHLLWHSKLAECKFQAALRRPRLLVIKMLRWFVPSEHCLGLLFISLCAQSVVAACLE